MPYLISSDYIMQIQPQFRGQFTPSALYKAEVAAMEEINGYVSKKYLTTAEFTNTTLYNSALVYQAWSRVYQNYAAYNAATAYTPGQFCCYNYSNYICMADTTGAFDAAAWRLVSNLYYAVYPEPLFNVYGHYKIGDEVYWAGHTYTALQCTKQLSGVEAEQYQDVDSVPLSNVFPNDPYNGKNFWADNGAYFVPAGIIGSAAWEATAAYTTGVCVTYLDNCVYSNTTAIPSGGEAWNSAHWQLIWQVGDNRSQLMVTHLINITLYWAHYAIAPNNIPAKTGEGYELAKAWCTGVMKGDITTPLQPIQPRRGQHILFDSQVKRGNYY
jgi:hypothetical protein